jgi:CHAT domain-containing protein
MRFNCIAQNNFHIDNYDKEVNELYDLFKNGEKERLYEKMENLKGRLVHQSDVLCISSQSVVIPYKRLALLYSIIGDNNSAIDLCNMAITLLERSEKSEGESNAELLGLKCKYLRYAGIINMAIETGISAKKIYDSLNIKSIKYAELMGDLAWVYGLNYNFEKSIELQSASVDIFKSAKDWLSLAETYNHISDYYQRAEKMSDAELFIKKAISLLNEYDDVNKIIRADAERLGDSTIITPYAVSQIKRRLDYDRINFRQSLARIYKKEGKIIDAINTEKENVCFLKNMRDDKAYALHLIILAQYYVLNKQFNSAKECIKQAFQFDKNQYGIEQGKILLSHVYFEMGDTIKAIQNAKEAISFFRSNGDTNNFIISEYALSLFYWKSNDYLKAEQYMSETLDLLKNMICNEFVGLTNQQKQRIWSIYEKYFVFYRHIIAKTSRNNELLSKLYNYILFSKSFLLDEEIDSDRDELIRVKFNWRDVKQHLSIDAIAIEFISTMEDEGNYNTYHALIIDKNTPSPRMITLYSESKLEEIKKIDKRDIRDIVGELIWKPILDQYVTVKDIYFSADGILHILPIEYYSADGTNSMFEKFNMHRLSSTKELIRESDKYQLKSAVLYGGLDYNQLKEITIGPNISEMSSIWRGIADRGGFDPLFNTALETQEIKELLVDKNIKTTLYSGESGTEESFRNLSGQSHGIIHLATHGMYINPEGVATKRNEYNFDFLESLASLDDPVKEDVVLTHSFLVMSGGNKLIARKSVPDKNNDGILTSKEISQLDFHGLDLVVLSACESALGDIDNGGVYGLQRGFKKAGANTILMSLGKVDDEATRILMVEFYRNLMDGKAKLQSLRNAQKYLRSVENGKYNDPKYWASFIMLDGLN